MSVTTHGGCWVVMREIGSDMWQSLTPGLAAGEKRCDGRATSWSPDGTKVAFTREGIRPGRSGIFVTALDGGLKRVRQLTSEQASSTVPLSWSPDGTQLAYDPWGAFECNEFLDDPKAVLRFEIADLSGRPPRTVRVVPGPDDVGSSIMGQIEWSGDERPSGIHQRSSRCIATPAVRRRSDPHTWWQRQVQQRTASRSERHSVRGYSPEVIQLRPGRLSVTVFCTCTAPTSRTKHAASRLCIPVPASEMLSERSGCTTSADTAWTPDGRSVLVFAAMFPQGPHKLRKVDRATGRAADLRSWPDPQPFLTSCSPSPIARSSC